MSQSRQPKGVPVGGQYAENSHDEAGAPLGTSVVPDEGTYAEFTEGNARIRYEWIGEGKNGDYDPDDIDDTPLLRVVASVSKYRLGDHPDLANATDDGFVEIASSCTREPASTDPADLANYARYHAEQLDRELLDYPAGPRSDQAASAFVRSLADRRTRDADRTFLASRPEYIADRILGNRARDMAGNRTKAFHAVRNAAREGFDEQATGKLSSVDYSNLSDEERAAFDEGGKRGAEHVGSVSQEGVEAARGILGARQGDNLDNVGARAAKLGYAEGQGFSRLSYEDMRDRVLENYDDVALSTPEGQALRGAALKAAMHGHDRAMSEMNLAVS